MRSTPARYVAMSMPGSHTKVTAVIAGYNLIQNRLLPSSLYVPANIVVSAVLVAMARRAGCSWRELGLDPEKAGGGVRLGLQAALLTALVTKAATRPTPRRHFLDQRAAAQNTNDILYHTLVRFPLGTALFEETAFRGSMESVWREEGSTEARAAVATAVLFGLWHIIPTRDALRGNAVIDHLGSGWSRAAAVVAGAAASGIASLGLSWLRRRSGSLVAPWLAHTAISCAGYLAGVVAWRRAAAG